MFFTHIVFSNNKNRMKSNSLNPIHWVNTYGDNLFHYAYFRLKNREIAEDIVQDTFTDALDAVHSFRGECKEKTWLFSILHNKIVDYLKTAQKTNFIALNDNFNDYYFDKDDDYHWREDKSPRLWHFDKDATENEDFYNVLNSCLNKLPTVMTGVFFSKYLEDEAPSVIQQKFDISSSNYWVILHRAKISLRECLEKVWFNDSEN